MDRHDWQNRNNRFASYDRMFYGWRNCYSGAGPTMLLAITHFPIAASLGLGMLGLVGILISAVVFPAIPLMAGVSRGHAMLGIIGAVITVAAISLSAALPYGAIPYGALFRFLSGLPVGFGLAVLISIIPKVDRALLNQSEIEEEMRRIRGY